MGIGFLVVGIGLFGFAGSFDPGTAENPSTSLGTDIWGWVMFANLVGGVTVSIVTNKKWLLWKANADDAKWYSKVEDSQTQNQPSAVHRFDSEAVANAFVSPTFPSADMPQTPPPGANQHSALVDSPSNNVDVNSATAHELVIALGINNETANHILSTRSTLGSFTSFDQLMTRTQVPPHLLLPHRNKLTFGEAQTDTTASAQKPARKGNHSARKLDI